MRLVVLCLCWLLSMTAWAGASPTWVCRDPAGVESVRDTYCPPGTYTVSVPAAAVPASPLTRDYGALVELITRCFAGAAVLLAILLALKLRFFSSAAATGSRRPSRSRAARPPRSPEPAPTVVALPLRSAPDDSPRPADWSLELLHALEWKRLELLCRDLWRARGYAAELTRRRSDGGVDVIVNAIPPTAGPFAIVQCQPRGHEPMRVEAVRAFWALRQTHGAERAILYGLSGFSVSAVEFADDKPLDLLSAGVLLQQIEALPDDARRLLLKLVTDGDYRTPSCPQCLEKMRLVQGTLPPSPTGSAGEQSGWYWTCRSYPRCAATLSVRPEHVAELERTGRLAG